MQVRKERRFPKVEYDIRPGKVVNFGPRTRRISRVIETNTSHITINPVGVRYVPVTKDADYDVIITPKSIDVAVRRGRVAVIADFGDETVAYVLRGR